jgi:NADP-dependent 3-hydroxy acid dehydrogenase YdfG
MSTIEGKVVAITGASSGIGEAAARLLAERGAKVVVGARRSERLEKLVAAIQAKKGEARFRTLDVTSREDMKAFMDFSKAEFGRVDILVNNAGIMPLSPMPALKVCRGAARHEGTGPGHIVNVASIGAHVVVPTGAVYCATKFAVWALSEGLRQENPDIRVTTISPGVVATELGDDISDQSAKQLLGDLRKTALTPDAIARAIAYAVEQPDDVDVNEVIVRPTTSSF